MVERPRNWVGLEVERYYVGDVRRDCSRREVVRVC